VQNPAHSIRMTKRLLREGARSPLETILELSAAFQTMSHKTPDHSEAVNAMIEKRPPVFTGR
jgi:2-(1,2-epoxy-1,2-dihydrophenyl)acetyl-CoA isomerase